MLTRWLGADPAESVAWLRSQPVLSTDMLSAAFAALARAEPAFLATLLDRPMSETDRRSRTSQLTEAWAERDPRAAALWLQTRPRDAAFFQAANTLVGTLAARDPDAAFAFFATLPADADLGDIAGTIANRLADRSRAVEWLLTRPDSSATRDALQTALGQLGAGGSAQILAYAQRIPPGAARAPVYAAAMRLELAQNPASAVNLLRGVVDPAARDATLALIADEWSLTSRADARAFAQELPPGGGRDKLASTLLTLWPDRDAASAFAWARTLPQPEKLGGALASFAQNHPTAALEFLKDAPAGPLRDAAVTGLVYGTLSNAPARAAEQLLTFGSPELQPRLVNGLASRWADQQPREASAWARALPAGMLRDNALIAVAGSLAKKDAPAALSLLPLAQEPESRYRIARWALLGQQQSDEAGARLTLASLPLPAADLASLRADLDSHR